MKTIGITGGTGLIGKHLSALLTAKGLQVIIFTRRMSLKKAPRGMSYAHWDETRKECDLAALRQLDAMVHLAGAGVADKRWTDKRKQEITDSRVKGTRFLVDLLREHGDKCKTFIAASATGYYGPYHPSDEPFTENAAPYTDFLAATCRDWEAESHKAEAFARTVILRFGIVLGKESGAFPQFAQPVSLGVAPVLGLGNQVISWIEVDDLARLISFAIEQPHVKGIYNAVTPDRVTQRGLIKAIATAKGGYRLPVHVPATLLKILLGELSTEVLKSCAVSADKIIKAGFTFRHPHIDGAVKAILKPEKA